MFTFCENENVIHFIAPGITNDVGVYILLRFIISVENTPDLRCQFSLLDAPSSFHMQEVHGI